MPLILAARSVGFEINVIVSRKSGKYNGLQSDSNLKIFLNVCQQFSISTTDDQQTERRVLFTIENVGNHVPHSRNYSIQHGFDYVSLGKKSTAETVYVAHSQQWAADIHRLHNLTVLVPDMPIPLWDHEAQLAACRNFLDSVDLRADKFATILYPEMGHIDLASDIVSSLLKNGYTPLFKQRSKHQSVKNSMGFPVFYDSQWFPSESIMFPLISDVVIGFGSSAYTDLAEIGCKYINVDVNRGHPFDDDFKYPVHLPNFLAVKEDFAANILKFTCSTPKNIRPSSAARQQQFVQDLMIGNF